MYYTKGTGALCSEVQKISKRYIKTLNISDKAVKMNIGKLSETSLTWS